MEHRNREIRNREANEDDELDELCLEEVKY